MQPHSVMHLRRAQTPNPLSQSSRTYSISQHNILASLTSFETPGPTLHGRSRTGVLSYSCTFDEQFLTSLANLSKLIFLRNLLLWGLGRRLL